MVNDATQKPKRGRKVGVARQVADDLGVNIRTVQRALAARRPAPPISPDEKTLRRFMETFRNFATFCRENSVDGIADIHVTDDQANKLREWNSIVLPWLRQLNQEDATL